jgi:mono/diheme cytochrome c family protein
MNRAAKLFQTCCARGSVIGWLVSAGACVLLLSAGLAGARAQSGDAAAPAGNADKGKMLFSDKTCDMCHGEAGEGGTGPQIAPPPKWSDYISQLREPLDKMPAFDKDSVSDAEAADIYAFLKSAAKKAAARSPLSTPAGQQP